VLSGNACHMAIVEIEKYKKFLKSEMEKMDNSSSKKGKNVKID